MAITGKIKRSLIKTFLNTGTSASPVWVLIGDGVTNAKISYNPKTLEETYISEDSANISVESYSPTIPIEMTALNSDAAFEYIDALRIGRSVLSDVETEIVNVWLYETPAGGYYYAERQAISIQADDFGGDGGAAAKMNYTLNFIDDPIAGIFKPTATAVFEVNPITTELTTMDADGVTLTPLFATDKTNLLYTASVINTKSDTDLVSTLVGSESIVQKVGEAVVGQGAAAALAVGLNHITIAVTVGTGDDEEINTYRIDITRAAA